MSGFAKRLIALVIGGIVLYNMIACRRCSSLELQSMRYEYKNLINVMGVPNHAKPKDDYEISPFSDMGAWHAYHLPSVQDKDYYGGFPGPLYIAQEYGIWLSKCFNRLKFFDVKKGTEIKLSTCKKVDLAYYPGLLVQSYMLQECVLSLELRFVTNRTALVTTKIKNNGKYDLEVHMKWDGELLKYTNTNTNANNKKELKPGLKATNRGVLVNFPDVSWTWHAFTSNEMSYEVRYPFEVKTTVSKEKNTYIVELNNSISLKPNEEYVLNTTNTYTFTNNEKIEENKKLEELFRNPEKYVKQNAFRWEEYLSKAVVRESSSYNKLAVKALETLITNWRSPAGAIKRNGITPSMSYAWFHGIWAWDSWKQAVAVANFSEELAKDNIRVMFDEQRADGMIIDAVFYNKSREIYPGEKGGNWNERNSKPPLAAWAVWKVYEATSDLEFLKELYPKLVKYHNWWYTNRDYDKNGIAEYGATVDSLNNNIENIMKAAAWESGMDNAVRFDADYGVKVLENKCNEELVGYSINQESVDLNAYLYAEKEYLSKMARLVNDPEAADQYEREAAKVKSFIQNNMFDEKTGFFYDIDIDTKRVLTERGKGSEGFIPLWAGVASVEMAKKVRDNILDVSKFNTKIPFPTASKDNPRYSPEKYWRGPVWLDQAYFGVEGLSRYGYIKEAKELVIKLVENAEGIMKDGEPFRENYNPETGDGQHCTNFSWSAGMLYMFYKDYLMKEN